MSAPKAISLPAASWRAVLRLVEHDSLPQRGTAWKTARGAIGIWTPAPNILLVGMRGHGEAGFSAPIIDAYSKLQRKGQLHLFFDADELENYDTPLRTDLTQRFVPDRKRIGTLLVLVKSRIVAMGVSVANLALGMVSSTAERARFKTKVDACLYEHRVIGFSSDVLVAFTAPQERLVNR